MQWVTAVVDCMQLTARRDLGLASGRASGNMLYKSCAVNHLRWDHRLAWLKLAGLVSGTVLKSIAIFVLFYFLYPESI